MQKFFLHYISPFGSRIEDLCDPDFADLVSARREAVMIARQLMGDQLSSGRYVEFGRIAIFDEAGVHVTDIHFGEAIKPMRELDEI